MRNTKSSMKAPDDMPHKQLNFMAVAVDKCFNTLAFRRLTYICLTNKGYNILTVSMSDNLVYGRTFDGNPTSSCFPCVFLIPLQ